MPTVDVNIFKAINPRWNFSVDRAKELARALVNMGFPRPEIVCHPQGDGKGWGITQEQTLEEIERAGVPSSEGVYLLFAFPGRNDRQSCAQIVEDFAHGAMVGYEALYGVLNESAQPGDYLKQLTRIPRVWAAILRELDTALADDAPPAPVRPPISFFPPVTGLPVADAAVEETQD